MLVIRLARTGKKKQAYFRIVVADKRRAVTSKFIEILGNYDPHTKKLSLNQEKLEEYIKNGAQPSNSVAKLLAKEGLKLPKWVNITEKKKAPKKEPVAQEPKVEAPAEGSEPVEATEDEQGETTENTESVAEETEASAEEAPAEELASSEVEKAEEPEVVEETKEEESAEK